MSGRTYLDDAIETRFNRPARVHEPDDEPGSNDSSLFPTIGKPSSAPALKKLTDTSLLQAHRHVLFNSEGIDHFLK
ncbi:hypothetical protein LINPERPRIM_LOCUS24970 [Linum perenne]